MTSIINPATRYTAMAARAAATTPANAATPQPHAGAIVNAALHTMVTPDSRAEAMLWQDGVIRLVGSNAAIAAAAEALNVTPQDVGGRVVTPGFVDAHTHFLHVGVKHTRPDLRGATSRDACLERIATWLAANPGSDGVIAEGWDEADWPEDDHRPPTIGELDDLVRTHDAANADRPLVFRRMCGHVAYANTAALAVCRARWDDDRLVDTNTGRLEEDASLYLNEVIPSSDATLDAALQFACATAHQLGVTAVGDYSQAPYRHALLRAAAAGTLSVRTASSIYVQQLDAEISAGFRTGRAAPTAMPAAASPSPSATGEDSPPSGPAGVSTFLRDGGLKIFLDGSLGARTAWLRDDYSDQSGNRGTPNWTPQQVQQLARRAHAAGIQLHLHAIGDAAVELALDAIGDVRHRPWTVESQHPDSGDAVTATTSMAAAVVEPSAARGQTPAPPLEDQGASAAAAAAPTLPSVPEAPPPLDGAADNRLTGPGPHPLRHRIEHDELLPDDLITGHVATGAVASSQPNFVGEWSAPPSPGAPPSMYAQRLGEKRVADSNPFGALRSAGVPLAFGSDGMPFGPMVGIDAVIHHPVPGQRLSPPQAIWHYTHAAAWSLHWEDALGTLEPGKRADFVVLDLTDIQRVDRDTPIASTWVDGVPCFRRAKR